MKTLKFTVLVVFAIGLLTGVSQFNGEKGGTNENDNHELSKSKVKLTAFKDITVKGKDLRGNS